MNAMTALALAKPIGHSRADKLAALWDCLNIIEDFSVDRGGDYKTIHAAVMKAQEVARQMEPKANT